MTALLRNQVLIVEDDDNIRRFVAINLKKNGFEVTETATGESGLRALDQCGHHMDAIVLDIMLPDMNGFDFCRQLREIDPHIVIIFLTARGQDLDKIRGLELGADDYIVKPFNPLELVARIRTVLRRTQASGRPVDQNVLASGPITVNLESNQAFNNNDPLELTPKEYLMLKEFLSHPGKALSRNELLNLVWGEDFVGDTKTVDVHVRKLREKIEEDGSKPQRIETVWGVGYRWRKNG
ncbi:response regulator transcription factor [Paenibacillus pinihumi]|uniref:response regulator transcription factor n=1 Tax=Paenibacillus pinihumi TaxID=669462 RepID=UPI00042085C0|nr:response regulator transcription factor [Paenibacillus pinihumi]